MFLLKLRTSRKCTGILTQVRHNIRINYVLKCSPPLFQYNIIYLSSVESKASIS